MSARMSMLMTIAVVAALLGGGLALTALAPSMSAATTANGALPTGPAAQSAVGSPSATSAPGAAVTPAPTDDPQATDGPSTGSELEPFGKGQPSTTTLPAPTAPPYILTGAMPKNASKSGALTSGFPSTIPAAPHSDIDSSSLSSEGTRLQATLTATSTLGTGDVLAFYRTTFAKYGLYDLPAPATGGQTAVTFARDDDSITLAITPSDDGVQYILFGALTVHD